MRKSAAPSKLGSGFNPPFIGTSIQKPIQAPLLAKESMSYWTEYFVRYFYLFVCTHAIKLIYSSDW